MSRLFFKILRALEVVKRLGFLREILRNYQWLQTSIFNIYTYDSLDFIDIFREHPELQMRIFQNIFLRIMRQPKSDFLIIIFTRAICAENMDFFENFF